VCRIPEEPLISVLAAPTLETFGFVSRQHSPLYADMGCHRQGGDPLYTGPAKKYPLKNFANISITIERYDMKFYTLLTHSIIHKCRKFH